MGYEHESGAAPHVHIEKQFRDARAGRTVEITRRLVRDKNFRAHDHRPRKRNALLLATRKLRRIVRKAFAKPNGSEFLLRPLERIGRPGKLQRNGHVFQRRHGRNQMKGLKHDADMTAAEFRETVFVQHTDIVPADTHDTVVGPFQPRHNHKQRRLAGAGRPGQRHGFAAADRQGNILQNLDFRASASQIQRHAFQLDCWSVRLYIVHENVPCNAGPLVSADVGYVAPRRGESSMSHSNVSWPALRMLVLFFAIGLGLCGFGPNSTLAQEKPFKLVVFGDSLTAGYRLPENAGFTSVLEAELRKSGRKVDVVNASVSGDTASGGLARLDWALGDGADAVLVELGANDMLRGIDPARTEAALDEIIRRIKAKGAKVLLAGMVAAPGMGKAYEQKFNAIYDTLAKKHAVALYPFFLDGVATNKSLNLGDGIHPNEAGVKAIVENIMPAVIKLIDGDKPVR